MVMELTFNGDLVQKFAEAHDKNAPLVPTGGKWDLENTLAATAALYLAAVCQKPQPKVTGYRDAKMLAIETAQQSKSQLDEALVRIFPESPGEKFPSGIIKVQVEDHPTRLTVPNRGAQQHSDT